MRIRSIRPEFFTDKVTGSLSVELQILLIGLWCHADAGGHFEDDPELIAIAVFGRKPKFNPKRVQKMLEELVALRLIERFECDYQHYLYCDTTRRGYLYRVIDFNAMQKVHHAERIKIKVLENHQSNADAIKPFPPVSGIWSPVSGSRLTGDGSLSSVSREGALAGSRSDAPLGAPPARAPAGGGEGEPRENIPPADAPPKMTQAEEREYQAKVIAEMRARHKKFMDENGGAKS